MIIKYMTNENGSTQLFVGAGLLAFIILATAVSVVSLRKGGNVDERVEVVREEDNVKVINTPDVIEEVQEKEEGESVAGADEDVVIVNEDSTEEEKLSRGDFIDKFIYPNSKSLSRNSERLSLESEAGSSEITDWYESLIRDQGMNVTSFVKTTTNGQVHNELVGADGQMEVKVVISGSDIGDITSISVIVSE